MKWTVGLVSLAAVATAQDCQSTYNGAFEYAVAVPGKRDLAPRFACAQNALVATLKDGILKDSKDRQGEIVANSQFQFDPILQPDALETEGFSICGNRLAVKGSTKFFRCLSGKFYNLYTKSQGKQCEEISLAIFPCGGADNGAAPVTQIGDGQAQAPSNVVSQIGDGQAQAPTGGIVTQIGDGQLQAPTGGVVTQIGDGQAQAPTGVVTQIGDGQAQAPTGVVTQIGDGQAQAPTGVVTQIGDGQAQAPTGIVTQIGDGQAQAPTGTPVAVGPNAGNKIIPGTFAALFVGLVGTVLYL